MKPYPEWSKYELKGDPNYPLCQYYVLPNGDSFYVEPVFYTMLQNLKDLHPECLPSILEEMDRVIGINHHVIFAGDFEYPFIREKEGFIILELFDITNRLNIYVEDKSRGSDYGD